MCSDALRCMSYEEIRGSMNALLDKSDEVCKNPPSIPGGMVLQTSTIGSNHRCGNPLQ